jgi:hypothetical protein
MLILNSSCKGKNYCFDRKTKLSWPRKMFECQNIPVSVGKSLDISYYKTFQNLVLAVRLMEACMFEWKVLFIDFRQANIVLAPPQLHLWPPSTKRWRRVNVALEANQLFVDT